MASRWIVTALGKDQPGIVAGVTRILYQLGCNLEDSAMTRLEGEFAIMLIFSAASSLTSEALCRAFHPLERQLRLSIHMKPLTAPETRTPRRRGRRCLISVYGADRPGIVFRVADALARAGVNVTDVHTHRSAAGKGRRHPSLYLVVLDVELRPRHAPSRLERQLQRIAKRLDVQVSVRPGDADVL